MSRAEERAKRVIGKMGSTDWVASPLRWGSSAEHIEQALEQHLPPEPPRKPVACKLVRRVIK